MTKQKTTKRALLSSMLVMLICVAMLIGTTFAWFTDSVTSGNNVITAGNLDIDVQYTLDGEKWNDLDGASDLFQKGLWEPGHTEVVALRIKNNGSLALKYAANMNIVEETVGKTKNGADIKLSDILAVSTLTQQAIDADGSVNQFGDFALSLAFSGENSVAYGNTTTFKVENILGNNVELLPGAAHYLIIKVDMAETVGNEANHNGTDIPKIDFGINVLATQYTYENDSFDNQYDKDATYPAVVSNTTALQAALDSAADGDIIQLMPGVNYGVVYMGRPTKNNNTTMTCDTHNFTATDETEFKTHLEDGKWHGAPKYTTTLKNLTVIGAEDATVAGLVVSSGHYYGDVYDCVLDKDYDQGSAYYSTLNMENVVFSNVNFTGKIDINTSDANSVYNGITFDSCTFTTGGTAQANGAAIRYYNESNNGNVKNIVVNNCSFNNCYQGVYVHHVNGITITGSSFNTTGHNAIAIQSHDGAVNLKNVVITNNTFDNISDRVIRFGDIAADSDITIQGNTATNSGDEDGEVIKATTIADGITTSISNNTWNGVVVNDELKDKE